jgi:hypothetical protein
MKPQYDLFFRTPDLAVYKNYNEPNPYESFKIECVEGDKTFEPENWALSISESGNLMAIILKRKK